MASTATCSPTPAAGTAVCSGTSSSWSRRPQNHPLGATFSYCNSGFVLAGRVIEKITGKTWDQVLTERIITPLGLIRTVTLPEQALLLRAAVGHIGEPDEPPRRTSVWGIPRSSGPAGIIVADVTDLLEFARMHLAGGVAGDGSRVLSERSVAEMQAKQADLPDVRSLGDSWGLGWMRFGWDAHRLFGHDGNTIGQSAFLRILPEQGLAVTLLSNGGNTKDLYVTCTGRSSPSWPASTCRLRWHRPPLHRRRRRSSQPTTWAPTSGPVSDRHH